MPTRFRVKRSTVSGITPTTGDIASGELAINLPDRKLFTSNGTAVYELGSNLTNLAVSGNVTIGSTGDIVFTPGAGISANGSLGTASQVLSSNGSSVYWAASTSSSSFVRQTFTANSTVNTIFTVTGGYTVNYLDVYKNGVKLVNGVNVTVNDGSTVVLAAAAAVGDTIDVVGLLTGLVFTVNTAAQYIWTNVHTHSANVVYTNGSVIVANAAFGTNGQVLTSNGTSMYWSSAGFTNGQSISVNNLAVTGPFTANSSNGTAGQVLTTSGTGVYWSSAGVNTAAQYAWTNTHTFSSNVNFDSGVLFVDSVNNRVGVGTSTPSGSLHVIGGSIVNGLATFLNGGSGEGGELNLLNPDNSTIGCYFDVGGTDNPRIFSIRNNMTMQLGQLQGTGGVITFHTEASERMRLVANGNLGIGNTAPAHRLRVEGDISLSGGVHANGAFGTAGQVLTSNGTGVYWAAAAAGVNTAAQYVWSNTHTFQNTVTFTTTGAIVLPIGTTAQRPTAANGMIRYNSNTRAIEAVANSTWTQLMADYTTVREQFTASNNQTTFTVTGGYVAGQVDVYYNGVKLRNGSEVNISDGATVVLAVGAANNALVEVIGIGPSFVISNTAQVLYQQFTATPNQSSFTVTGGYVPGLADVFVDGIKMVNGVDVNLSTGSTVDLTIPVPNGSLVEVKGYTTPLVSAQSSTAVRQTFTANSTVNNNFTVTGGYISGQLDVYYNGSKLVNGTDVNTSSGSTITLTSNAALGATIDVVGINYFTAGGGVTTPVRQSFTATANQTSFTITGGYRAGQIDVYQNGSKLSNVDDVNVSSGSAVVLAVGAANGDVIEVVGFAATSYQDSVRKSGDIMTGPLTISANLAVTGTATITGNVTTSGTVTDAVGTIRPLVSGVANTVSGTSVDYTGIPSWVRRIVVIFSGVSTNGTSNILVQIGAGSVTSSGYSTGTGFIQNGAASFTQVNTNGFGIPGSSATNFITGTFTISLVGSNTWVASITGTIINSGSAFPIYGAGTVTLSSVLDRVRITTVNGTDAFDAGTVNILYE
jgi:hypothetical protein